MAMNVQNFAGNVTIYLATIRVSIVDKNNVYMAGRVIIVKSPFADRAVVWNTATVRNRINANVDPAIVAHCVINVFYIPAVFMATVSSHGNVCAIEIGVEYCVIKISTTVVHINHVSMVAYVEI